MKNACYVVVARRQEKGEIKMYSKTVVAKCVGMKEYTKKKENGSEYNIMLANVVYENKENANLRGAEAESIKTNTELEIGHMYELVIVIQKVEEKYYKEIVSAKAIK